MTLTPSFLFPAFEFALFPSQHSSPLPLPPPPPSSLGFLPSRWRCKTGPRHLHRCRDVLPQITGPARQPLGALQPPSAHQHSAPRCPAPGPAAWTQRHRAGRGAAVRTLGDTRSPARALSRVSGTCRRSPGAGVCVHPRRLDYIIIFIPVAIRRGWCVSLLTGRARRRRWPHPQTQLQCPILGPPRGLDLLLDQFWGLVRDQDRPQVLCTV